MEPANTPREFSDLRRPLDQFRAKTKRAKIHPLEGAVVAVVCLHLVFLPWAIGGMRPWSQFISLGLAIIGFALALLPRTYEDEYTSAGRFRIITWPKLVKFPLFWIGLALLSYVAIQALNPAWEFEITPRRTWWVRPIEHTEWLPSGVRVPFERWGPWRMLLIYSSVFLTVCTIWVGFTRRRSLQVLFVTVMVNGLLLAAVGIAGRVTGNEKIFWLYDSPSGSLLFASFIYKNHAGIYLLLTLATTCGIAGWYYLRGIRRLEKSNPSGVIAFLAMCLAVAILVTYARGAALVTFAYLGVCIAIFLGHQIFAAQVNRKPLVAVALIVLFGCFLKPGLNALNSKEAWARIQAGISGRDTSLEARRLADKVSLEILHDYWLKGAGAGSFQFIFPKYLPRQPRLAESVAKANEFWEHAHNDFLEFPIELGAPGMILLLGGCGYLGALLLRHRAWENPLTLGIGLGLLALIISAGWDFPLQNPSILLTACVLAVAATTWAMLERTSAKT